MLDQYLSSDQKRLATRDSPIKDQDIRESQMSQWSSDFPLSQAVQFGGSRVLGWLSKNQEKQTKSS